MVNEKLQIKRKALIVKSKPSLLRRFVIKPNGKLYITKTTRKFYSKRKSAAFKQLRNDLKG
jgi:hypothetical protein